MQQGTSPRRQSSPLTVISAGWIMQFGAEFKVAGGDSRMKYDLVFEGGGAKGMVFVGACEEFFRRGHSFDRLLGTSAGAITATLLAAGYTPAEMLAALVEKEGGKAVFTGFMGPPLPFTDAELAASATRRLLDGVDFTFVPNLLE